MEKKHLEVLTEFVNIRDLPGSSERSVAYKRCLETCIKEFDYIVLQCARKYVRFNNHEDLIQEGRIALISALKSFKFGKGSWYWWANKYIATKLSREAAKHSTIRVPLKKSKDYIQHKVELPFIMCDSESPYETFLENDILDRIEGGIRRVASSRDIDIFYKYYGIGGRKSESIPSLCKMYDITRDSVVNSINTCYNEVKKVIYEE